MAVAPPSAIPRVVTCEFPGCNKTYSSAHSRRQHYRRFHAKEWQSSTIRRRSSLWRRAPVARTRSRPDRRFSSRQAAKAASGYAAAATSSVGVSVKLSHSYKDTETTSHTPLMSDDSQDLGYLEQDDLVNAGMETPIQSHDVHATEIISAIMTEPASTNVLEHEELLQTTRHTALGDVSVILDDDTSVAVDELLGTMFPASSGMDSADVAITAQRAFSVPVNSAAETPPFASAIPWYQRSCSLDGIDPMLPQVIEAASEICSTPDTSPFLASSSPKSVASPLSAVRSLSTAWLSGSDTEFDGWLTSMAYSDEVGVEPTSCWSPHDTNEIQPLSLAR